MGVPPWTPEKEEINMQAFRARSLTVAALVVLGLALFLSAAAPLPQPQPTPAAVSEIVLTLDPAQSTVHWTVDSSLHTVHGTFALKSGTLHFDTETGNAGGEIVVFATSGKSAVDPAIWIDPFRSPPASCEAVVPLLPLFPPSIPHPTGRRASISSVTKIIKCRNLPTRPVHVAPSFAAVKHA